MKFIVKIFYFVVFMIFVKFLIYNYKLAEKISFSNNIKPATESFINNKISNHTNWEVKIKKCEKWIVISSITYPTEQVKYSRDSSFEWCILLVADKKTPINWIYKDIIYLSIEKQLALAKQFEIIGEIPFNSHLRKMIGYLFAMSQNAQFIYEIKDDQMITNGLNEFKYESFSGIESICNQTLLNNKCNLFTIKSMKKIPLIQALNIHDSNSPSLILNSNQYEPFSSSNTLYSYNSFWSMIYPLFSSINECDKIRSLVTIRLLNEIDHGKIAFISSSSHLIKEQHVIYNTSLLISSLNEWKCTFDNFPDCFNDCIQKLVNDKILNENEIEFYRLWIKDLTRFGYKWPKIKSRSKHQVSKGKLIFYNALNAKENKTAKIGLESLCNITLFSINPCKIDTLILVTFVKTNQELNEISYLKSHFSNIVVCVSGNKFEMINIFDGFTLVFNTSLIKDCISQIYQIGFKQQTFLIIKQISRFKNWNFKNIIFEKIDYLLDDQVYLINRNVANGIRALKFNKDDISSICDIYDRKQEDSICNHFIESISKLNWHFNDLTSEYCTDLPTKTIWIPDLHEGPITDIISVLVHLGQNAILASKIKTSYPDVLKSAKVTDQLSHLLTHNSHTKSIINENIVKDNFKYYQRNDLFQTADAIICSFPSSMCEAFIPLNKTLIFNPAHRYNIARCSSLKQWYNLNENYKKLLQKSKLIVSSMSKYDQEYQFHYSGFKGYRLYSYAGFYIKNIKYNPIRSEILIGPAHLFNHPTKNSQMKYKELLEYAKQFKPNFIFKKIYDLYPFYTLSQLANHRAIVLFPYAVMTYSITDFYAAKIPIFVPSVELMKEWNILHDRIDTSYYCEMNKEHIQPSKYTAHRFSPNEDTWDHFKYWVNFADYYEWPFITIFQSWNDLFHKLETLDLKALSQNMEKHNKIRETDLLINWCKLIKSLNSSVMPNSFEEALDYFNISNLNLNI